MSRKMMNRTVLTVTILLFFIAMGFYFYSLLSQKEKGADMNLYTLIPQNSIAILETEDINNLFNNMDKLNYRQPYDALNVSDLLNGFRNNFKKLSESKAHGLSSQMSRIFISFHEPNTPKDQVLYCKLGSEDKPFIEEFVNQNTSKSFPPKVLEYRGEKIHIYSIGNDFLACYYKSEFLVISYHERLIEEVIDTYLDKQSVLADSVFSGIIRNKKVHTNATLYFKSSRIPHGESTGDHIQTCARIAHWSEFDLKMDQNAIYLSGTNYDTDSCHSFNNALKAQKPTKTFPAEYLPKSTYYLCQLSVSDFQKMQEQIVPGNQQTSADSCMTDYLCLNNNGTICNFYFYDSQNKPQNITSVSLKDKNNAENALKVLIADCTPKSPATRHLQPKHFYTAAKAYPIYTIPASSFMLHLRGENEVKGDTNQYGCFYEDRLLIAPNDSSIQAYIRQMNDMESISANKTYEEFMSAMAAESICLFMADMSQLLPQPSLYNNLLPSIFFKYKDFFKDFIITVQFTSAQDLIYPNIILTYKGEVPKQASLKP